MIYGARSSEHEISCVSAGSILRNLDPERFEAVAIGITLDGTWVLTHADPETLTIRGGDLPSVTAASGEELVVEDALASVDVVFPVLHGPYGEDGTIQGLLELAGVPYVGAGVLASAVAMDKEFTKKLLAAEGLPIGAHAVVQPRHGSLTADDNHAKAAEEVADIVIVLCRLMTRTGRNLGEEVARKMAINRAR